MGSSRRRVLNPSTHSRVAIRPPRGAPRATAMDHLGLEEAVDRLGQSIVVAVTDAADGRLDTGLGEPLRVCFGVQL